MVRMRFHFVPALGRFNEARKWADELNAACRAAGCVEGRMWALSIGPTNESVMEYEYESIAAWDADQTKFGSTAEIMKVFRSGIDISEPGDRSYTELWEEAPTLA